MTGEMWVDLLKGQGIAGQLHPGDVTGFLGVSTHAVRVMVPESDLERARNYLDEIIDMDEEEED